MKSLIFPILSTFEQCTERRFKHALISLYENPFMEISLKNESFSKNNKKIKCKKTINLVVQFAFYAFRKVSRLINH